MPKRRNSLGLVDSVAEGHDVTGAANVQVRRSQNHLARMLECSRVPVPLRGVVATVKHGSRIRHQGSARRGRIPASFQTMRTTPSRTNCNPSRSFHARQFSDIASRRKAVLLKTWSSHSDSDRQNCRHMNLVKTT